MNYEIAKIHNQIQATKAQIHRWQLEASGREIHTARVEAGARVLLYQSQLRVQNAKLAALISNYKAA